MTADEDIVAWLASPEDKLADVDILARAMNDGKDSVSDLVKKRDVSITERDASPHFNDVHAEESLYA